ncbi:MAG: hypothetical protein BVN35_08430 [Proteobacteria bacterium ST_bin11]|nr:MAG: hypothetical protein BVN35_08430 [Proteobacteria bacterium ST_bin11]
MIDVADVVRWVEEKMGASLLSSNSRVYIVGSFINRPRDCNDVDLLVVLPREYCKKITVEFRVLKTEFKYKFGLPLDCLILTEKEFEQISIIIDSMLNGAHRRIF